MDIVDLLKRNGYEVVEGAEETRKAIELVYLENLMNEMANVPREDLGKRQPGEKCMYEIQRKEFLEEKIK